MGKFLLALVLFSLSLQANSNNEKIVNVSILPQKYFVEQIAGDTLKINVMVLPGASPATYEPKANQMRDLAKSQLYFAIGVPYERVWLKKFKELYPNLEFVDTAKGINKIAMASHHHHHGDHDHDHDHEHEENHEHDDHHHEHKILDPHIWLDPVLVKIQAQNIADALIKKYPNNASFYKDNLAKFLNKLDLLDKDLSKIFKDKKGGKFLVFHPSWGYFAARYGLEQKAIEVEGKEPKPKELKEIIHEAKEDNIKVIFVQPQFSKKSAAIIAQAIGGVVISIDQLALDWENELRKSADVLYKNAK